MVHKGFLFFFLSCLGGTTLCILFHSLFPLPLINILFKQPADEPPRRYVHKSYGADQHNRATFLEVFESLLIATSPPGTEGNARRTPLRSATTTPWPPRVFRPLWNSGAHTVWFHAVYVCGKRSAFREIDTSLPVSFEFIYRVQGTEKIFGKGCENLKGDGPVTFQRGWNLRFHTNERCDIR